MTPWEVRLQHLVNLLVVGTGLGYAYFKYFAHGTNAYSTIGNVNEPIFHDAHVLVVPALVFVCGLIWNSHVLRNLKTARNVKRGSGLGLIIILLPMVATGYLVQTAVDESWRRAWVWIHLVTSGVWTMSYIVHLVGPTVIARKLKKSRKQHA